MRFSDGELRQFRGVLGEGTPGGLNGPGTAQALAVVREAARRFEAYSFRDSELAAAVELHSGKAVELPDDGNNDLVAMLAIYSRAIDNEIVHHVAPTATLAHRSYLRVRRLCEALGIQAAYLPDPPDHGYHTIDGHADVIFASHRALIHAYLASHLVDDAPVANYRRDTAILDQIDTILVDSADEVRVITAPNSAEEAMQKVLEAGHAPGAPLADTVWAQMGVADYFRGYSKLSGISGVAADSGKTLKQYYGLETVTIATERQSPREMPELLFDTSGTRLSALVQQVSNRHRSGQPIVIGVWDRHDGHLVSAALTRSNVDFRHVEGDEETAEMLWLAGRPGSVTLVPGHAVRGCDVPLHPHSPGRPDSVQGLAVLSVGRGRSARHDRALRGLAGRRGEPGDWQSFLAADDVLLRGLQSEFLRSLIPSRLRKRADGKPVGAPRLVDSVQRDLERLDLERKSTRLAMDHVEGEQCSQIYALIERLSAQENLRLYIQELIGELAARYIERYKDPDELLWQLTQLYPADLNVDQLPETESARKDKVEEDLRTAYSRREESFGSDVMREAEREVVFPVLNRNWKQHLADLTRMRAALQDVQMTDQRRVEQFARDAAKSFIVMVDHTRAEVLDYLFNEISVWREGADP